jgi:hypothetical protein
MLILSTRFIFIFPISFICASTTAQRPEESSITLSLSCDSAAPALYNNTLYSLKVTAGVDEAGTESLATIVPSLALTGVLKANRTSLLRYDCMYVCGMRMCAHFLLLIMHPHTHS